MAKNAAKTRKRKPSRKELESQARKKAKATASRAAAEAKVRGADGKKLTKAELKALRERDGLIEQYMPYAASIASRVCQSLSSAVDYEEVLCNARLGLLEAAKRFDGGQDVDFRTFALVCSSDTLLKSSSSSAGFRE